MLSTIIEKKKEEFEKKFADGGFVSAYQANHAKDMKSFLEKAIRESVEEALREVSVDIEKEIKGWDMTIISSDDGQYDNAYYDGTTDALKKIKEFMK